jgi:hypothetical protein
VVAREIHDLREIIGVAYDSIKEKSIAKFDLSKPIVVQFNYREPRAYSSHSDRDVKGLKYRDCYVVCKNTERHWIVSLGINDDESQEVDRELHLFSVGGDEIDRFGHGQLGLFGQLGGGFGRAVRYELERRLRYGSALVALYADRKMELGGAPLDGRTLLNNRLVGMRGLDGYSLYNMIEEYLGFVEAPKRDVFLDESQEGLKSLIPINIGGLWKSPKKEVVAVDEGEEVLIEAKT